MSNSSRQGGIDSDFEGTLAPKAHPEKQQSSKQVEAGLRIFLKASNQALDFAVRELKAEYHEQIKKNSFCQPQELKSKLQKVDDAFLQLTHIKKVLDVTAAGDGPIEKGRRLMKEQEFKRALSCFESAFAMGEPTADLILCAATAAYYANQYTASSEYADEVLRRSPRDFQALLLKAFTCLKFSKYYEALGFLDRAHEIRADHHIVQKYRKLILEKVSTPGLRKTEPVKNSRSSSAEAKMKRRWARCPVDSWLHVNDYGESMVMNYHVISLSAGGCLVEGGNLPVEFQFALDLPGRTIWGIGKPTYKTAHLKTGIIFAQLSSEDQERINAEVLRRAG